MARREETTRMCALTRVEKPVAELIRFVLGPDGVLVPDTEAKAEGRGVWISLRRRHLSIDHNVQQAPKSSAPTKKPRRNAALSQQ